MSLILALDQSTSATKALLIDPAGRTLDREALEHRQYYPQPGWVEHDAEEIWRNTCAAISTLLDRQAARADDVVALSITNQRETVVVFDRATGRPLRPAIVWQCRRGDAICAEHLAAGRESMIHRKTGLKLDAYFSASKLQWLVRHEPALRARLADGSALIGTIDTYLVYRLTGGTVFATDATNASRTLLFDIGRLCWDEELCALWEVPRRALPEVRESSARFGDVALDLASSGRRRSLPICGVMGDSQASFVAQRCFTPGSAKVTFGTGSSLLLNIGPQPHFSNRGVVTALAWTHAGKPTYALEGIIISSASTLTWLRDQLGLAADVSGLDELAQAVPDNGGVYLIPAFTGLGLPHWRPDVRALITGLSSHSDRRHVARAAFESIACQIRDALDAMRADAGVSVHSLRGDGGPTANRFLMQLCSDVLGVELLVAENPNLSALGAAWMGALGLGLYQDFDALLNLGQAEVAFHPHANAAEVAQLLRGWHVAVQQAIAGGRPTGDGSMPRTSIPAGTH